MAFVPTLSLKRPLGSLDLGHPWVYRQALLPTQSKPGICELKDPQGRTIGQGLLADGPIAFRLFTYGRAPLNAEFIREKLAKCQALRSRLINFDHTTAYRVVNGEGDGLPGLVVDRYGEHLVIRVDDPSIQVLLDWVLAALLAIFPNAQSIGLRRKRSAAHAGPKVETLKGQVPAKPIEILENQMRLLVDLQSGQKTGLFLDHRDSRALIRQVSSGLSVLNLYGYTGGFSIAAGLAGAKAVVTVDQSAPALELASQSWQQNELPNSHQTISADVLAYLEKLETNFDVIISDPPSFAPNEASVPMAVRAYRKLHRLCLRRVNKGGFFLAASCSSHIDETLFLETVLQAAEKTGRILRLIHRGGAGMDHPYPLAFPEGHYLKSILFSVE